MTLSHDSDIDGPTSSLGPDTVLQGRYRIVRQLGRGGMGAVYEALDERLGITVALKETLSAEPSMRRQFEHEARLLAGMQHPALPRVSDHFVEGNRAFLVMQYIGGVDLARIISQQPGPFPREQVIAWADQLLDALIYLHSRDRQVIHRDIKPHNLKLTSSGKIALLDFGLAKAQPADASVTASQSFYGYTRHYAPLEQIQDQRTDQRSDIYALGATLYHLLTGSKPPDALVRASALVSSQPDPLQPADEIHPAVGPEITAILKKALSQRPEDRYATADEFRDAFRRMGRTGEFASIVTDDIEAGVIPRTFPAARNPFLTIDEGTVVKGAVVQMAMVESTRRFGPGALTVTLVLLLALAGGVLYGSPSWLRSSPNEDAVNDGGKVSAEGPATTRKADRPQGPEKHRTTKNEDDVATRIKATKNVEKIEPVVAKREAASAHAQGQNVSQPRQSSGRPRVSPPSIRLPNPDFRENSPARATESPRAYRMSSSISPVAGPKFYRAADGTQIVKFPDGTTRFVRH